MRRETGELIASTLERLCLDPLEMPALLVAGHGSFTWRRDAEDAILNAIVLEVVATMARQTLELNPNMGPIPVHVLEKHYLRNHGRNAYGQKNW